MIKIWQLFTAERFTEETKPKSLWFSNWLSVLFARGKLRWCLMRVPSSHTSRCIEGFQDIFSVLDCVRFTRWNTQEQCEHNPSECSWSWRGTQNGTSALLRYACWWWLQRFVVESLAFGWRTGRTGFVRVSATGRGCRVFVIQCACEQCTVLGPRRGCVIYMLKRGQIKTSFIWTWTNIWHCWSLWHKTVWRVQ